MSDGEQHDRARTLAQMAPNRSVRYEVLAGREERSGSRLSERPVSYLDGAEAPAYLLTHEKRGIGVGTKGNTTSPSGDRGTVILVTGRRTLCLVGRDDSDEVISVPHERVAEVAYHTGLLGHRFVVKTPRKQYHCWVSRGTDESILGRAAEYVRERKPEAPYEDADDGEDEDPRFMYRGQPVRRENHPGLPDEPPGDTAGTDGDPARGSHDDTERDSDHDRERDSDGDGTSEESRTTETPSA